MLANYNNLSDEQKRAAIFIDIYYRGKRRFIAPYIINKDIEGIKKLASITGIKGREMYMWKNFPTVERKEWISLTEDYIIDGVRNKSKEKFITQMAEKSDDNPTLVYRIAEVLGMSVEEVYSITKGSERKESPYDFCETKKTSERQITFKGQTFYVGGLTDIYEFVCLLPNMEEVMKFINENQYTKIIFKSNFNEREFARKFSITYGEEESKKMIDRIKQVYVESQEQPIKNSVKAEKKSKTSFRQRALELVRDYIADDGELCLKKDDSKTMIFKRALSVVSEYYPEIYEQYLEKSNLKRSVMVESFNEQVLEIVGLIENGVDMEDGEKRPFDIIDYYHRITIHPRNISHYCHLLDPKYEFKSFKKFIKFNSSYSKLDDDKLKSITHIIKKDGKERAITEQEKNAIIQFLISSGLPILTSTYDAAVRRYSLGYLSLEGIENPNKAYT